MEVKSDIQEVKDCLQYLEKQTSFAANKTIEHIETSQPILSRINHNINSLLQKHDGQDDELKDSLQQINADIAYIRNALGHILVTQEFQDLTGQVIRNLEDKLETLINPDLLRADLTDDRRQESASAIAAEGPQINAANNPNAVSNQHEADELLASLNI